MYIFFFQLSIYTIVCVYFLQLTIYTTLYMYENFFNVSLLYSTQTHLFLATVHVHFNATLCILPLKTRFGVAIISAASITICNNSHLITCILAVPWLRRLVADYHRGGPGSIAGQSMWDLWWTKWHWDRFFSKYFGFPLSISFHRCSVTRKNEKLIIFITGLHNKPQGCGASVAFAAGPSTTKNYMYRWFSEFKLDCCSWYRFRFNQYFNLNCYLSISCLTLCAFCGTHVESRPISNPECICSGFFSVSSI
jgi:hypothetical protein